MNDAGRIGFVIKGDYDSTATYEFLDVVYFGDSSYVAKKETTGNEPENSNEYWQILANTPDNSVTGVKGAAEATFRGGNVNLTPANIGLENVDNVKQMPLSEWTWKDNSGQPSWVWGGNEAHKYSVWNPSNFNVNHAATAAMPVGFANRMDTATWGNQMGSCITCWNDDATGSLQFRKNNPINGQLSLLLDGYFYQREGLKRCLDEEDWKPENIGNNGTGGISIGSGLMLSSEKIYNYIFPSSVFKKKDSYYTDRVDGEEYYVVDYAASYAQKTPQFNIMLENIGLDILNVYEDIVPGLSVTQTTIVDHTDYIIVKNPYELSVYFYSELLADNAPQSFSLEIKEFNGTKQPCQTLLGAYNRNNTQYEPGFASILEIGIGTASSRANALRLNGKNQMYLGTGGAYNSSGADHAEFIKPWADGNPDNEDRVGYLVTIKDGLLYKAETGDYIAGITSGNPCVVGNADEDYYWKYERDEFNRIVMDTVPETVQKTDKEGNLVFDEESGNPVMLETGRTIKVPKLAEGYDPALQTSYIERKDRKEWDYVGMLGVLPVRDDGTCLPDHFCKCGKDGIATLANEKDFNSYMVIERISEHVVSVLLK